MQRVAGLVDIKLNEIIAEIGDYCSEILERIKPQARRIFKSTSIKKQSNTSGSNT